MSDNPEIKILQEEIEKIKARNRRVEADKAWELSWARKLLIIVTTYILISIVMISLHVEKPFLNAIVPAVAYILSTTSYDIIKSWWLKRKSR